MSHIAVDLKVIEVKAPAVARAAGVTEDRVLAGLVRLWHRCWSCKSDTLKPIEVAGIFGGENVDALICALLAFDLLEATDDAYRVKGADRYLRIQAGRSAGGRAASGNLNRGKKSPADSRLTPGLPPADSRLVSGLSPSTEHRAPKERIAGKKPPAPPKPESQHQTTIDRLWATWRAAKACDYVPSPRDFRAVKEMLQATTPEAINAAWANALRHVGFPSVTSIHELQPHFGRFSDKAASPEDAPLRML